MRFASCALAHATLLQQAFLGKQKRGPADHFTVFPPASPASGPGEAFCHKDGALLWWYESGDGGEHPRGVRCSPEDDAQCSALTSVAESFCKKGSVVETVTCERKGPYLPKRPARLSDAGGASSYIIDQKILSPPHEPYFEFEQHQLLCSTFTYTNDDVFINYEFSGGATPQDCEVSSWSAYSECTEECGGGLMVRTRTIVPARYGGTCAVDETDVEEVAPCNTQPCPVECVLGHWEEWASCTASCAGGTKTRERAVVTAAQHGGEKCGNTTETIPCNLFACPTPQPTPMPTPKHTPSPTPPPAVYCAAMVDVVVVIDSSGSLTSDGFENAVTFVEAMILHSKVGKEGVRYGVVQYSEPGKYPQANAAAVVVRPLSSDSAALLEAVRGMKYVGGSTYTGEAMELSLGMLQTSKREAAATAVLVVTDGQATDWHKLKEAAKKVKDGGSHLMMAVVTPPGADFLETQAMAYSFSEIVSKPVDENLHVELSYEALVSKVEDYATRICDGAKEAEEEEEDDGWGDDWGDDW